MNIPIKINNTISHDAPDKAGKNKYFFIPMSEIISNPYNWIYEDYDTHEEMKELVDRIVESGLEELLVVTRKDDKYMLISGHRRLKALKNLFDRGIRVVFDTDFIDEERIPVIIKHINMSDKELFKATVASNTHRVIKPETRRLLIEKAVEIYNGMIAEGEKPAGKTRDVIADLTDNSISGRRIQDYVEIGRKGEPVKMKRAEESTRNDPDPEEKQRKELKKITSIEKHFTNLDLEINENNVKAFQEAVIPLINAMMRKFNIELNQL